MTVSEAQRAAARKGGLARAKQFDSAYQKAARAKVRPESNSANGRKGFEALKAKRPGLAARILADWRAANPSGPEQTVDAWLAELGIEAERELSLFGLFIDRAAGNIAIEVDGGRYHGPDAPEAGTRAANDRRKEDLAWALGFTLIRIPECDIRNGSGRAILEEHLCK